MRLWVEIVEGAVPYDFERRSAFQPPIYLSNIKHGFGYLVIQSRLIIFSFLRNVT